MTSNLFLTPCELIIKIGSNESDEIRSAIKSVLRKCSIEETNFLTIESQIQSTFYFGSFTSPVIVSKSPFQCQSLSCVLLLPDAICPDKRDCFKSINLWRFHHKIELLNDHNQVIARQDYFELSQHLPLWSVSRIPQTEKIIVRFNVFTKNFDSMLKFYIDLFQRKPNSSKSGFSLFFLSPLDQQVQYQFSIKYSPAIVPYGISQTAHFKFRLNHLNHFVHQYSSKLFTITSSEFYTHDPDGNLLNLHACQPFPPSSLILRRSSISLQKPFFIHDSGIADTSDPSNQFLHSIQTLNHQSVYPIHFDRDNQSHSSNDSGRWSSISSNDFNGNRRIIHHLPKKPFKTVHRPTVKVSPTSKKLEKLSLYDSAPHLFRQKPMNSRYYSSINDFQRHEQYRPRSTFHLKSKIVEENPYISFDVDAPESTEQQNLNESSVGYLNAFLEKKRQQTTNHFDPLTVKSTNKLRPVSAPTVDEKPKKSRRQTLINSSFRRSAAKPLVTNEDNTDQDRSTEPSSDDGATLKNLESRQSPRINVGITLDSRLRKTPVLDMLRSTTMESIAVESSALRRTASMRSASVAAARF